MDNKFYYFMAFLAYFIWGMTFPLAKMVLPPLKSISFVFLRSFMGFLFLQIIILVRKESKQWYSSLKNNFWNLFFLALIPYAFSYILQFYAIQYTTAINQSIISQTSIFWVVFLNFIIFKQKPKLKFIISVIIGFLGVLIILTKEGFKFSGETLKGDILSILAFISWSTYSVFSKPISMKMKPIYATSSIFLFGSLFLFPLSLTENVNIQLYSLTSAQWGILIYLGIVCTGLAYFLHLFAMSNESIKSEYVVYFSLIMPIVSVIFSVIFLDEILTWRIALGGFLVLFSVLILKFKNSKNVKNKLKIKA